MYQYDIDEVIMHTVLLYKYILKNTTLLVKANVGITCRYNRAEWKSSLFEHWSHEKSVVS